VRAAAVGVRRVRGQRVGRDPGRHPHLGAHAAEQQAVEQGLREHFDGELAAGQAAFLQGGDGRRTGGGDAVQRRKQVVARGQQRPRAGGPFLAFERGIGRDALGLVRQRDPLRRRALDALAHRLQQRDAVGQRQLRPLGAARMQALQGGVQLDGRGDALVHGWACRFDAPV
jgi:hypothetical protein